MIFFIKTANLFQSPLSFQRWKLGKFRVEILSSEGKFVGKINPQRLNCWTFSHLLLAAVAPSRAYNEEWCLKAASSAAVCSSIKAFFLRVIFMHFYENDTERPSPFVRSRLTISLQKFSSLLCCCCDGFPFRECSWKCFYRFFLGNEFFRFKLNKFFCLLFYALCANNFNFRRICIISLCPCESYPKIIVKREQLIWINIIERLLRQASNIFVIH